MTRFPSLAAALTALSACAVNHAPPAEAVILPAATRDVTTREIVELSAFLVAGPALSELTGATCRVSAGAAAVSVTPPVYLSVAVAPGPLPPIEVACGAPIGPVEREARAAFPAGQDEAGRRYPENIGVDFSQWR